MNPKHPDYLRRIGMALLGSVMPAAPLGAAEGFKHGQHLTFDTLHNKPLCNLFISMLQNMGIESAAFGSSGGTLSGLSQL